MTGGAGTQHFARGGLNDAPFASRLSVRGRCNTQMWSRSSTAMPATWPMIQLLGSVLGQYGSTVYCGTAPDSPWRGAGCEQPSTITASARLANRSAVCGSVLPAGVLFTFSPFDARATPACAAPVPARTL